MAGDAEFTQLLLGMGLTEFSMHPAQISEVKQAVLRADARRIGTVLPEVLDALEPSSVATRHGLKRR
jgi:phosphotransferase system enzyme I (PtsI)